jgi:hypothetical protein
MRNTGDLKGGEVLTARKVRVWGIVVFLQKIKTKAPPYEDKQ